jgi:CDP-diacylglycerol--glycerol-3-phosphate 3-phosphatidyltransferase
MSSRFFRDLRSTPNIITLSRIILLWFAVLVYFYVAVIPGLLLAVLAGVTDYLDGYIARRTGQVTRLGEILDQFSDVCFESFAILLGTVKGYFPAIFLCLYLFREFWVMTIRRFMAAAGMNIPSSWAGKFKTNLIMWGFLPSFITIGGLLPSCEPAFGHVGRGAVGLGILASYLSAWGYTRAFMTGYDEATSKLD